MSKSANKHNISKTGSDFYKCRFPYVSSAPYVPRAPSVPRVPSAPRIQYEPRSIRKPNSYGPRTQKFDEYIKSLYDTDDSDTSSGMNSCSQENLEISKKQELETIHEKPPVDSVVPKTLNRPIIHCYNTGGHVVSDVNNPVTAKKSAPIKKISFVLPSGQKLLESERMDWKDYHRLEVIHKFMDDLEADFPSVCTTGSIGKSVEGRNLKILKISNSNASNVAVWMDAGIHAREWIAPAVNTYIANHITRNFDSLPESVTNKDWYFLPVVNPDGYHYSHTTDRMWRKNRACFKRERPGVDLNRNFGVGWGGKGSSNKPDNAFYRGPRAFSEPESSAMRDVLIGAGIKFKVYITLHSYGQIIIFPYACTPTMAPNYLRLLEGATVMSKAIYNTNGETYKVGISNDVMYPASGTSNDFAHGGAGIDYCYLIELRSKKHKFKLPKEEIEDTANEILNGVLALMEFIDTYPHKSKTDPNTDALLMNNDSFMGSYSLLSKSNTHMQQHESNDRKNYLHVQKSDNATNNQDSFVKLTHIPVEEDDSLEQLSDVEWPDPDDIEDDLRDDIRDDPVVEHQYTAEKETEPYEGYDEHLNVSREPFVPIRYDEPVDLTQYYNNASETTDPPVTESDSFVIKTDSVSDTEDIDESWANFYEHEIDFRNKRNNLLEKIGITYNTADTQWYF